MEWEKEGKKRMAFTVFQTFPCLQEDRFLFIELSLMFKFSVMDLQSRASSALRKTLEHAKVKKYEVG